MSCTLPLISGESLPAAAWHGPARVSSALCCLWCFSQTCWLGSPLGGLFPIAVSCPGPTRVCYIWVRFVVKCPEWWVLVLIPKLGFQVLLPGVTWEVLKLQALTQAPGGWAHILGCKG